MIDLLTNALSWVCLIITLVVIGGLLAAGWVISSESRTETVATWLRDRRSR